MADADRLTAELTRILTRARDLTDEHSPEDCRADLDGDTCSGHDAERTVAAFEQVLKLADGWDAEAARADDLAEKRSAPAAILLSTRAQAHRDCSAALRETVTRHLIGESGDDEAADAEQQRDRRALAADVQALHREFVMRLRAAAPASAYARKLLASVDPDGGLS